MSCCLLTILWSIIVFALCFCWRKANRAETKEKIALLFYISYLSLCVNNRMLCSLTTKMDNKKRLFAIVSLDLLQFVFMPNLFVCLIFFFGSLNSKTDHQHKKGTDCETRDETFDPFPLSSVNTWNIQIKLNSFAQRVINAQMFCRKDWIFIVHAAVVHNFISLNFLLSSRCNDDGKHGI